jgi:hypothetical protein
MLRMLVAVLFITLLVAPAISILYSEVRGL